MIVMIMIFLLCTWLNYEDNKLEVAFLITILSIKYSIMYTGEKCFKDIIIIAMVTW